MISNTDRLADCRLCPRQCGVDRLQGETGYCRSGAKVKIASYGPHRGEEPFLSGTRGSGTIFFSNCTLKCVYCQNYQISQQGQGKEYSVEEMAGIMLELERLGCHNINLVSPTSWVPQIVTALESAKRQGLKLPVVYNTNGYERPEIIRLLVGLIDIYLPDAKYSDDKMAAKYSDAKEYVKYNRLALAEMYRQVGKLELDTDGLAVKGLVVRHLVLPNNLAGTKEALDFIAREISLDITVGLMAQYHPCWQAGQYPELARSLRPAEYRQALAWLEEAGISDYLAQDLGSSEVFLPDFNKERPFEG